MSAGARLRAVIFDVDGTLVDSERHGHRVAFNQAFEEFGLPYRWDEDLYGKLLRTTGGERRIDRYLSDEGVPEDERNRLAPALHKRKTQIMTEIIEAGRVQLRPGAERLVRELASGGFMLAVATTGSRGWIDGLLHRLMPDISFAAVVTGDEVSARKPDPEAFTSALERLGAGPEESVAVEDSAEGLEAAQAADLPCAVVVNGYTRDHDLGSADLVLDGFGSPEDPADVIADPRGTGCRGVLDSETLKRLLAGVQEAGVSGGDGKESLG